MVSPDGSAHEREERTAFGGGLDAVAVEVVADAHVGVQAARILVEVQERAGASVEDATRLLDDARQGAELGQQTVELVECLGARVPHTRKVVAAAYLTRLMIWNIGM